MRDKTLNLFCSNVRGIVCNWQNIKTIDWSEYDVLAFNEVWNVNEYKNLVVDGFEILCKNLRVNSRGGGTIIFVKKNLDISILNTPFVEGCVETTGCRIGDIIFINIYRPPRGDKDQFVETITQYLSTLRSTKIILGGDFNLNTLEPNRWINSICNLYQLEIKLAGVTRIESGTCIDNFLSNIKGEFKITEVAIADHFAISARINCPDLRHNKIKEKFYYRAMKENNWLIFNNQVHALSTRGDNLESKWSNLLDDIKSAVETSFPLIEANKKYLFTMSSGLLKSKDTKNRLLRQYKRGLVRKEVYVNYNRIYRKLIKTEQCNVFKNNLVNAGSNGKMKWKAIKSGLLLESENIKIKELNVEGNKVTEEKKIAEAFKNHFETCANKLAEGLPVGEDTSTIMAQGLAWKFDHTTELDLVKIIKSLMNKNSSGYDSLSNKMLKKEPYVFAKLLKPLINESLDSGIFPECLKVAKVIPIFKKGEVDNLNNYRPISLLPVLSKVFEKVLNDKLTKVIDEGFIDEYQFGFRRNHSTEDAVIKFVDKIERDLALGKHVVSVYVDVSKAFDSCDHGILLKKLKRTGLDETGIKLMASYLKNRKQIVVVNEVEGGFFLLNIGVGQGTVLGPTLFKIYIMDMHLYTSMFCVKFADDSSFECSGSNREEVEDTVNGELIKISRWFKSNRLTLHPEKSRYIIHSRDKLINVKLDGSRVMRCGYGLQEESVKLLGLNIDENLDWKIHINNVQKKIGKGNYLLWRHKKKLNIETKKIIYESFVRTHLLYCLTIWGGAKNVVLKPLQGMIKKIWRKIGPYKQHTLNRLYNHKILKIEHELEIKESKLLWKWENSKIPPGLNNLIKEKQDRLRGRRFEKYRNSKPCSLNYRLAKRADNQIRDIANATSLKCLAAKIKSKIIETKYNYNCVQRNCRICQ